MKVRNRRQLRRALTGNTRGFVSSVIIGILFPAALFYLHTLDYHLRFTALICICIAAGLIGLILHGHRVVSGCLAVSRLARERQLEAAIVDFNCSKRYVIGDKARPDAILGREYIFLLAKGKVIPAREISALIVEQEEGIALLYLTHGGTRLFLTDDHDNSSAIERSLEHMKRFFPSCPEVEYKEVK